MAIIRPSRSFEGSDLAGLPWFKTYLAEQDWGAPDPRRIVTRVFNAAAHRGVDKRDAVKLLENHLLVHTSYGNSYQSLMGYANLAYHFVEDGKKPKFEDDPNAAMQEWETFLDQHEFIAGRKLKSCVGKAMFRAYKIGVDFETAITGVLAKLNASGLKYKEPTVRKGAEGAWEWATGQSGGVQVTGGAA